MRKKIFKNVHRSLKLDIICLMFFFYLRIKNIIYKTINTKQCDRLASKILKMYEHLCNQMYTSSTACNMCVKKK